VLCVSCSQVPATCPYTDPCRAINITSKGESYYRYCFEVLQSFPSSMVHRAPSVHAEDTPLLLHSYERDKRLLDEMLLIGTSRPCLNARV